MAKLLNQERENNDSRIENWKKKKKNKQKQKDGKNDKEGDWRQYNGMQGSDETSSN